MIALISGIPDPSTSRLTNILYENEFINFLRHGDGDHHSNDDNDNVNQVPDVILNRVHLDKLQLLVNHIDCDKVSAKANPSSEHA